MYKTLGNIKVINKPCSPESNPNPKEGDKYRGVGTDTCWIYENDEWIEYYIEAYDSSKN